MNKATFVEVLEQYELPSEDVYEDLSEFGKVLWHNEHLAVKIVCAIEGQPCLSLVVLAPSGDCYHFERDLTDFGGSEVGDVIAYVKQHSDAIRQSAISTEDSTRISLAAQDWKFKRV